MPTMPKVYSFLEQAKYGSHTLWSPWPFMQWGLDVVGPLLLSTTSVLILAGRN